MTARPQGFCSRGHDTKVTGVTSQNFCRICKGEQQARRWAIKRARLDAYKVKVGCQRCGYNRHPAALAFHHRDPSLKLYAINPQARSWKSLIREAKKCVLLCFNCHQEVHAELRDRAER